jgi:hypothetical protein
MGHALKPYNMKHKVTTNQAANESPTLTKTTNITRFKKQRERPQHMYEPKLQTPPLKGDNNKYPT